MIHIVINHINPHNNKNSYYSEYDVARWLISRYSFFPPIFKFRKSQYSVGSISKEGFVDDFVRRQHGRWLVENQEIDIPVQRFQDLDALLFADT